MKNQMQLDCGLSTVDVSAVSVTSLDGDILLSVATGRGDERIAVGAFLTVKQARALADFLYSLP